MSEGTADLYVEPFLPRPTLVVAGASPVASTLSAIAPPLGFRIVRMGAATDLDAETVPFPRDTWMVVASFGEFDEDAVAAGLKLRFPYVGLVASSRRAERVVSELRERGFGEDDISAVRSPAGLPVGAGGQEGISLSIMAEIFALSDRIAVMYLGRVGPLTLVLAVGSKVVLPSKVEYPEGKVLIG